MVDRLQAGAIATRFLIGDVPGVVFREVWAARHARQWLVSFGKVFSPNVVESPGGWTVAVDAKSGQPEWFPAL
jgi:hypothetical protein